MQHQTIPLDQSVQDAIEDVAETVDALRLVTDRIARMDPRSLRLRAERDHAADLTSRIAMRASRVDLSGESLIALTQESRRRAMRNPGVPGGRKATSRDLLNQLTRAEARIYEADAAVALAQKEAQEARAAHAVAEADYQHHCAGPMVLA